MKCVCIMNCMRMTVGAEDAQVSSCKILCLNKSRVMRRLLRCIESS